MTFLIGDISDKFIKYPKFSFDFNNYAVIIFTYPEWKAYNSTKNSPYWVKVYLNIDIFSRKIYFPPDIKEENQSEMDSDNEKLNEALKRPKYNNNTATNFFKTIPNDLFNMCSIYRTNRWNIISAYKILGKQFQKFYQENPSILYLLVNIDKLNPTYSLYNTSIFLKESINKKQKNILRIARFPETKRVRKIFKKINPQLPSIESLLSFRRVLNSSTLKERTMPILFHSKVINSALFSFFYTKHSNLRYILSNNAIYEMSELNEYKKILSVLKEIHQES